MHEMACKKCLIENLFTKRKPVKVQKVFSKKRFFKGLNSLSHKYPSPGILKIVLLPRGLITAC